MQQSLTLGKLHPSATATSCLHLGMATEAYFIGCRLTQRPFPIPQKGTRYKMAGGRVGWRQWCGSLCSDSFSIFNHLVNCASSQMEEALRRLLNNTEHCLIMHAINWLEEDEALYVQQCRFSTSPLLQRVNEANSRIEKDLQSVAKDTTATRAMTAQLDKTTTQIDKKIDKLTNEVCMALRKHSKSSLSWNLLWPTAPIARRISWNWRWRAQRPMVRWTLWPM